ncbi:MAG TPA: hypothetical protein VG937_06145 [Polyangiaceae bacterium]|nr:hypothetical protein [Polyangiaceae bacterium]
MKATLSATLALSLISISSLSWAQAGDCRKEAEAFVNGPNGKGLAAAHFVSANGSLEALKLAHPCATGSCGTAYLSAAAQPVAVSSLGLSEGFTPIRLDGGPAKLEWRPVARVAGSQCPGLVLLVGTKGAAKPVETKPPVSPPPPPDGSESRIEAGFSSNQLNQALRAYHEKRQLSGRITATGSAQSLDAVAGETLQILGQIVADRASAEAYRLIKDRLEKLLGCPAVAGAPPAPPAAALPGKRTFPKPTFPETCKVLRPLRMEDVATSHDALQGALAADGLRYLMTIQNSLTPAEKRVEEVGAALVVTAIVVPLIVRPKLLADDTRARAVVGALEALVDKHYDDVKWQTEKAKHAIAAGVLAYTRCAYEAPDKPGTTVADCDFAPYADAYAGPELDTQTAARALTAQLIAVATLTNSAGRPDAVQRVLHAVDAVFASSCMLLDPAPVETLKFECPRAPEQIDASQPLPATTWLSFAQPIIDAALERDSNALVASIAHVLQVFADAEYAETHQRAFLLLGSLLQYSRTYAAPGEATAEQLHEQRSKILESLTRSMTDRTAREGDDIWSFGGSLRLVGGVRVGGTKPAVLSPLGLPLGVGFDHVGREGSAGLHLEFSPVDLGQYVAYDNRAVVKTPEVADAVSPSVTIGAGWGRSMPLVLGATFGYSPAFQLNPSNETKGVFNAGVTLGIYVPLVDVN